METTKTLRKYVTPSIGVLDIRIERGLYCTPKVGHFWGVFYEI